VALGASSPTVMSDIASIKYHMLCSKASLWGRYMTYAVGVPDPVITCLYPGDVVCSPRVI